MWTARSFKQIVGTELAPTEPPPIGQGSKDDEPADKSAAEPPGNLPYELNRFVGRQKQIVAISELFEAEEYSSDYTHRSRWCG